MSKAKAAKKTTEIDHDVTVRMVEIAVNENLPAQMYLRSGLADGTTKDGRAVDISQSGASLIITVGAFRGADCRQFTIDLLALAKWTLDKLL